MGGSASRELEAAQSQVRRLTCELQKVKRVQANGALAASAQTAEKLLQQELQSKAQELKSTQDELQSLRSIKAELPRLRAELGREMSATKEELLKARQAEKDKDSMVCQLQQQLIQSKEELEEVFGKLKFAETEKNAVSRIRRETGEEQRLLYQQQREAAQASAELVAEANAAIIADASDSHPVFGQLLADFGHKRLYRGAPNTLWAGTLLWERQRAFRQERANVIATAKAKSRASGWPGAIVVVESGHSNGSASMDSADECDVGSAAGPIGMLIDGQHRLGAAHLLSQREKLDGALATMLVEVYPPMSEQGVKDLFTEINRAEPVLLIDLPDGGASETDNAIITSAAEQLAARHPEMFKASQNCRPPHLNVDVLRAEMHRAELLSRHRIKSTEELIQWIEVANQKLAMRTMEEWVHYGARAKTEAALQKALAKAKDNHLYIGGSSNSYQREPTIDPFDRGWTLNR